MEHQASELLPRLSLSSTQLLVPPGSPQPFTPQIILCSTWQRAGYLPRLKGYLQNDVIEPDQVLRPGRAFAVIFRLLLQQGPVQAFRHVLIPPDGCGQLDVGQVAARYHMQLRLHSRKLMFWESTAVTGPGQWG